MYNIAITKENKTEFFNCTGDKPRQYPTLADALVSAQYLGLSRGDVELHFVKEGASISEIAKNVPHGKKAAKSKQDVEANLGGGDDLASRGVGIGPDGASGGGGVDRGRGTGPQE